MDLLDEAEQRLFRRLAVFVGGCTLEAVEAVCYIPGQKATAFLDEVTSLLDKSLLQVEHEDEVPRLQMLMTVREYGLECLQEHREVEVIYRAHALYYLALTQEAEPHLKGAQQLVWLAQLGREQENVRAALQWLIEHKEGEFALRLSSALRQFWYLGGHWSEGRRWLSTVLGMPSAQGSTPARAKALNAAGEFASNQSDLSEAYHLLSESVTLARELVDEWGLASSLRLLGGLMQKQGEPDAAYSLMEECQVLCRRLGSPWDLSHLLLDMGSDAAIQKDDYIRAEELYQEGLALAREAGDRSLMGTALSDLGEITALQGDFTQAVALYQEGLIFARA